MSNSYKPLEKLDGPDLTGDLNTFLRTYEAEIGTYDPDMLKGMMTPVIEKMAGLVVTQPGSNLGLFNKLFSDGLSMLTAGMRDIGADAAALLALAPAAQATRPVPVRVTTTKPEGLTPKG